MQALSGRFSIAISDPDGHVLHLYMSLWHLSPTQYLLLTTWKTKHKEQWPAVNTESTSADLVDHVPQGISLQPVGDLKRLELT